jgi:hypothetical protein
METHFSHPSKEVTQALIRLTDALCEWERNTGRQSALILREEGGFVFRAVSGKPDPSVTWQSDAEFTATILGAYILKGIIYLTSLE